MSLELNRRDLLRFGAIGVGGIAVATLAGCAPGTTTSAPVQEGAPTDFTFASWGLSEDAAKGPIQDAMTTFSKANDGIEISPVSYPYNDYLNQLTLQVRGGQFTGAAQLDVAWLSTLAALGKLADLGGFTSERGYTDSGLTAGQYDGVQYGLPWTIGAVGLIANAELFDRAGASLTPTTIEEFEEGLRAIKGLGVIPYAASTKTAQLKDIMVWIQTHGSPIIEDNATTIGDEASIKAVEWYKKLYDEGLIAPDVDRAGARTLFAQAGTALYDDAPVGVSAVTSQSPDSGLVDKMTPMARPVLAVGDTPQEVLWGHLIVVVEGEGAGTTAEFAQWVTSDEEQTIAYFESLGLPPTTDAALSSPSIDENTFVRAFTDVVTVDAKRSPLWQYPGYAQMETAIAEQVQSVLIGNATPAQAMKTAGEAVSNLVG